MVEAFLYRESARRQEVHKGRSETYELFEAEARERLRGRDEEDWLVLASALSLSCVIWTKDMEFFGTGVPVWTSDRVEIFLRKQIKSAGPEEVDL